MFSTLGNRAWMNIVRLHIKTETVVERIVYSCLQAELDIKFYVQF